MSGFVVALIGCFTGSLMGAFVWGLVRHRKAEPLLEVRRLDLHPGDELVLSSKRPLTEGMVEQIAEELRTLYPGHKALVLDDQTEIAIVREKAESIFPMPRMDYRLKEGLRAEEGNRRGACR